MNNKKETVISDIQPIRDEDNGTKVEQDQRKNSIYPEIVHMASDKENISSSKGPRGCFAGKGHYTFLQKRLTKGHRYFDSGDYQMAKQIPTSQVASLPVLDEPPTGDEIPTPNTVPKRKISN